MRFGINLMAWSAQVGPAELALLPGIAELGYDGVELPLLQLDTFDPQAVRAALQATGLACTASSALARGASLLEPAEHPQALAWLRQCCQVASACGATLICGPLYAPVGQLSGRPRSEAEWNACVQGLRAAGTIADEYGITLALEVLNRFETYFLNTAADALRLVEEVDHPAIGIHLDSFHMHIEEKDLGAAVRLAGKRIAHLHASENDRGIVGTGQVNWAAMHAAINAINYDRWLVAETFSGMIPEIAAAAAIWRPLVPDPWTYARESLAAMRRIMADQA